MAEDQVPILPQTLKAPAATDPRLSVVDNLFPSSLVSGAPQLAWPDLAKPVIRPIGFQAGFPYLDRPELTQIIQPGPEIINKHLGSKILYRSATGFERAMADVDSDRITKIDAELIRDIWDPWKCPLELLQYLAWALGVEYWNDDWDETTKRAWVAIQITFKSMRGTRKALEMVVDYAGRDVTPFGYKVTNVLTQPMKVFSGPSLTQQQREDWLQRLPQVRVWRTPEQKFSSPFKTFYNSSRTNRMHDRRFCLDGVGHAETLSASVPSDALDRLKRRARWIVNDVETDIRVSDYGPYFQLHKASVEDSSVFSDRPFGLPRYFIPSTAHDRLITIQPSTSLPWRTFATPTLEAVTSEPELVKVDGLRKHSVFCDTPLHDYFVPSSAASRIYQRYAVLDRSVRELRHTPVQFMGVGRYGFPNFTAWAEVSISGKLSPKSAGFGYWLPKDKFYLSHNPEPVRQVKLAIQGAKALRDKVMLKIGPQHRFLAGRNPILAGVDVMPAGSQ